MTIVSIIIPYHNRLELLNNLLYSIPDIEKIEIVLINDHSNEKIKIKRKFKFAKIIETNNDIEVRYAGAARNKGIKISSGKYIFFADSDDLINSNRFSKILEELEKKNLDILFTKFDSFKDNNSRGSRHINYNWLTHRVLNGDSKEILVRFVSPVGRFIRRNYIKENKLFFEKQKHSNDIFFAASLMLKKPSIKITDEVVYLIRESNKSLTSNVTKFSINSRLEALNRYNFLLKKNNLGYLMAPAIPHLYKLIKINIFSFFYQMLKILLSKQPVFFSYWTLYNLFLRQCSKIRIFKN